MRPVPYERTWQRLGKFNEPPRDHPKQSTFQSKSLICLMHCDPGEVVGKGISHEFLTDTVAPAVIAGSAALVSSRSL